MFTAIATLVTPSKVHIGKAMHRSPKRARQLAEGAAWDSLTTFDRQHGLCSSIGVDALSLYKNGKKIYERPWWD